MSTCPNCLRELLYSTIAISTKIHERVQSLYDITPFEFAWAWIELVNCIWIIMQRLIVYLYSIYELNLCKGKDSQHRLKSLAIKKERKIT